MGPRPSPMVESDLQKGRRIVPWGLTAVQEAAFWRKRGSKNKTKSWLPPFYHTKYHYTIMPKYNFASCLIQKNMATVQVSTYCYLENPAEFHAQNKSIQSMWWGDSLCTRYRPRHFLNGRQFADLLSNGTKFFAVIRDPFDRFVSGYVDKCINEVGWLNEVQRCFGCLDDLRCFLDAVFRLLVDYQAGKINRMTNMAEYYITHFAPQTWYCDFEHHKNDYTFIIYHGGVNGSERTAAEFDQMYASSNVPKEQRDYIQSEMLHGRTLHSTRGSLVVDRIRHRVRNDPYISEMLMLMYYHDYVEFGFNDSSTTA